MKPIKLIMKAFGPYAGAEEIDFGRLEGKNLFLVTGPTGSGKTTIFDAISFALYGETSGNERSADSLRSQFAHDDELTFVGLEFELRGVGYIIERTPKQKKPKVRGEGFTDHSPTAELWIDKGGKGEKVVTGIKEVNDKIQEIIGINSEQFRQIMMIPQGDFRRLITESSQDREKVLQKIFDTGIYRAVQARLLEAKKEIGSGIEKKKDLVEKLISRIDSEGSDKLAELLSRQEKNTPAIEKELEKLIKEDKKTLARLKKEEKAKRAEIDEMIKKIESSRQKNKKLEQLESSKDELSKEDLKKEEMDDVLEKAKKGESALLVWKTHKSLISRQREFEEKDKSIKETLKKLEFVKRNYEDAKSKHEKMKSKEEVEKRRELSDEISRLRSLLEKAKGMKDMEKQVESLKISGIEMKKKKEVSEEAIKKLKDENAALSSKKDSSQEAKVEFERISSRISKLEQLQKSLKKARDVKKELENVKERLFKTQNELEKAVKSYEEKNKNIKEMESLHRNSQAAMLAYGLEEGTPCPVCGSTHHEKFASFTQGAPSTEELEKEKEKLSLMSENKSRLEKGCALAQYEKKQKGEELEELLKDILGEAFEEYSGSKMESAIDEKAESNREEIEKLKKSAQKARKLGDVAESCSKGIEKNNIEMEKLEKEKDRIEKSLETKREEYQSKMALLNQLRSEMPQEMKDINELEKLVREKEKTRELQEKELEEIRKRLQKENSEKAALESLHLQLQKDKKALQKSVAQLEEEFKETLCESGFENVRDYEDSRLEKEEIERFRKNFEDYQKKIHAIKEGIRLLEEETRDYLKIDIEKLQEAKENKEKEYEEISSKASRVQKRLSTNEMISEDVKALVKEMGDEEQKFKLVKELSDCANGMNSKRMTFERYVLAAFMEDIVRAANIRLAKMSSGRYRLIRTEHLERKNKQSGLELEVFDNYTGGNRHVKTLSGGESFKASLSMALGLSDVVQSYCGGVRLDTMFIDEGFGTLDPESLDSAISCLIDLQKTGRLVGIISHVPELRERIDARLEVRATNSGSHAEFVVM